MSDTTHEDSTAQVSVKRWRRFAVDRLYVNDGDGGAIGSFDLRTGAQVINLPAQTVLFEKAVAEWLNSHPEVTRSSTVVPVSESSGAEEPPVSREPPASPGRAVAIDQTGTAGTPSDSDEPGTDLPVNQSGHKRLLVSGTNQFLHGLLAFSGCTQMSGPGEWVRRARSWSGTSLRGSVRAGTCCTRFPSATTVRISTILS